MSTKNTSLLSSLPPSRLAIESLVRLNPRALARNPVMFVVGLGTALTIVLAVSGRAFGFAATIALILLATLLFANAAEALAEARGKAQASSMRSKRENLTAQRLRSDGTDETVTATALRRGDRVRVSAGALIPCDGEIVEGAASINESAVTGESAPVLREAGTDHSGVSAGTKVLSDEIVIEVTTDPGTPCSIA